MKNTFIKEGSMKDDSKLSKQQLKSKETKDRIFKAAKDIMQKEGYESLSIKNICDSAGVSNGSFYHHFKTKDDLLSYYIEDQPSIDPEMLDLPQSRQDAIDTIIKVYLNYATYCKELGVEFMASYYTPKNLALNPHIRTERPYPIITVQTYVEKAIAAEIITMDLKIDAFTTDIRMLVIGNVFEWCLNNGQADIDENIRRSLGAYLNITLH